MAKPEPEFKFPTQILQTLDECSAGGFLLFVTTDRGDIMPYMSFNSQVSARSLISFAADFTESFQQVSKDNLMDNIADSMNGEEDGSFDESFGEDDI